MRPDSQPQQSGAQSKDTTMPKGKGDAGR